MQLVDLTIETSKRRDAIARLDQTDMAIARVTAKAVCEALQAVCAGSAEIVAGEREFWGSDAGAHWHVRVKL
jgi:hypothetical protein